MALNRVWHAAHRMPKNASQEQRITWHEVHAKECGCRPIPEKLRAGIAERRERV